MRARKANRIVTRRDFRRTERVLVAVSGCSESAWAAEILDTPLAAGAHVESARCQSTAEGAALLMTVAVAGGPVARCALVAKVRRIAERHAVRASIWAMGSDGRLQ